MKCEKGFSLAEIMIAMGLLSVLTLGVSSMMKNMQQGQATAEVKLEQLEIRRVISMVLMDRLACENTLKNIILGNTISDIKNSSGVSLYSVGKSYGNNTLKISSIQTKDLGEIDSSGVRSAELLIKFDKLKKMAMGQIKQATIRLNVVADSTTKLISSCYSDSLQLLEQSCESLGGAWSAADSKCNLPSCAAGEVLQKLDPTGAAICRSLNCPVGTNLSGLDSSGAPVCTGATYQ